VVLISLEDFSNYALNFEKIGKGQTTFGKWYWVGDRNCKGNFLGYFNNESFNLYDKKWASLMNWLLSLSYMINLNPSLQVFTTTILNTNIHKNIIALSL